MEKLKSRKFWISIAAALASLGAGITGLVQGNEKLALAGGILLVVSSSIYAFCEAWVDASAVKNNAVKAIISDISDLVCSDTEDDEDDCK